MTKVILPYRRLELPALSTLSCVACWFVMRLAVSKQTTHRIHTKRFNIKKLNEVEAKEQYRVEISNRSAALKNLDDYLDINRAWENIRENIKISAT
jgi:hypothetical protein